MARFLYHMFHSSYNVIKILPYKQMFGKIITETQTGLCISERIIFIYGRSTDSGRIMGGTDMEQMTLFDDRGQTAPLASRLRPKRLEDFVGQEHLLGKGKMLRQLIERDQISSMIFWGPPGVGKTTLASIIAGRTKADFINFSAVTSGIKEIKDVMSHAETSRRMGIRTVLFVDEIHRFNKAQQDAFLPYVEKRAASPDRATTENLSFEINAAFVTVQGVCSEGIGGKRPGEAFTTCAGEPGRVWGTECPHHGGTAHSHHCFCERRCQDCAQHSGDGSLERGDHRVWHNSRPEDGAVYQQKVPCCMTKQASTTTFIFVSLKSMRNSDPDAAIYWMCRGRWEEENSLYIARLGLLCQ